MAGPKKPNSQQAAQDARAQQLSAEIERTIEAAKRGSLPLRTPRDFTNEGARRASESTTQKKKPRS